MVSLDLRHQRRCHFRRWFAMRLIRGTRFTNVWSEGECQSTLQPHPCGRSLPQHVHTNCRCAHFRLGRLKFASSHSVSWRVRHLISAELQLAVPLCAGSVETPTTHTQLRPDERVAHTLTACKAFYGGASCAFTEALSPTTKHNTFAVIMAEP